MLELREYSQGDILNSLRHPFEFLSQLFFRHSNDSFLNVLERRLDDLNFTCFTLPYYSFRQRFKRQNMRHVHVDNAKIV